MINLDTHMLVYTFTGQLRSRERKLLESESWGISAIVLWEIAKLTQLGRLRMSLQDREVRHALSIVHIWPIDLRVAEMSTQLDFKSDPADELIAATSIVHEVPLMTRDRVIRTSKKVPLAVLPH